MNKEQAIAYGKTVGVKFYVKNTNGGLIAGYTTREEAEKKAAEENEVYATHPWHKGENLKAYVTEA